MELPDKEILVKDLFQASIAALEKFQIMIGSDAVKGIALDVTAYYGDKCALASLTIAHLPHSTKRL